MKFICWTVWLTWHLNHFIILNMNIHLLSFFFHIFYVLLSSIFFFNFSNVLLQRNTDDVLVVSQFHINISIKTLDKFFLKIACCQKKKYYQPWKYNSIRLFFSNVYKCYFKLPNSMSSWKIKIVNIFIINILFTVINNQVYHGNV